MNTFAISFTGLVILSEAGFNLQLSVLEIKQGKGGFTAALVTKLAKAVAAGVVALTDAETAICVAGSRSHSQVL